MWLVGQNPTHSSFGKKLSVTGSGPLCSFLGARGLSFPRDNDPENHIGQEARQTTWDHQDQEEQAKPEWADTEKGTQAATDARN